MPPRYNLQINLQTTGSTRQVCNRMQRGRPREAGIFCLIAEIQHVPCVSMPDFTTYLDFFQ